MNCCSATSLEIRICSPRPQTVEHCPCCAKIGFVSARGERR